MNSAVIFIALAALIVGVAKGLSFWNGKKSERLNNAQETIENVSKANVARSDASHDDELLAKYNQDSE